ncbi:MAG: NADPH-dependent 7-cyano-7-deazaguanine reductase QueF [Alphaproteobacteria bacterium CG_4_10_14_0_2_um_filter_63_37]|nr:MAG: NADPH-dependent 7-cyano-7-deazaguanine reductase QueF [Proteobacteria bacterium CG1_02_64_396]PJA24447.1 MAG: NADPH-dependent 7-cyano-7-deazaguanine reductase QueF [Alphaproteobacteria bacterium CG_4_10_14_0_2_um_filter_63_37]
MSDIEQFEILETFPNPNMDRDYLIHIENPEFTCLCPKTGQPDYAVFTLDYVPGLACVELKSLKLYFFSYRNEGAFHEAVTNRIADHLIELLDPRWLRLVGDFYVRGGIQTIVQVEHKQDGWAPTELRLPGTDLRHLEPPHHR